MIVKLHYYVNNFLFEFSTYRYSIENSRLAGRINRTELLRNIISAYVE